MKYFCYLCFWGYMLLWEDITEAGSLCPHPDFPTNGNYTPHQKRFEHGDEITYSCNKGFALAGKDRRICKSNSVWADHTPFCDPLIPLSNPSVTNKVANPSELPCVIDGNQNTCFDWQNANGEHLYLHLNKTIVVRMIRMFLKKGLTTVQISTGLNNDMKICTEYQNFIETPRWIEMRCKNTVMADTFKMLVSSNKLISICEIEVYGKEEGSCDHPPSRTVSYGHLEVSRTKATLICEEGYRSESKRLVCEGNNSWTGGRLRCEEILCDPAYPPGQSGGEWARQKLSVGTISELRCLDGYRKTGSPDRIICQQNGTWTKTNATCKDNGKSKETVSTIVFCSVGIFIVLLIIALLATTIHLVRRQRSKEVVVVYQTQCDGSIPLSESEIEYAAPYYEVLKPEPPSTPRPVAKISITPSTNYQDSKDCKNNDQNLLIEPPFGTMKASTIYGS